MSKCPPSLGGFSKASAPRPFKSPSQGAWAGGMDTCIPMDESLHRSPEKNATLFINYTPNHTTK